MALGADAGQVRRMILGEGGVLLASGLALGLAGGLILSRLIRGLLFGVEPYDPITLVIVVAVMAAIGLAASGVPAMRAAGRDGGLAIRAD
jgi:ABC-type antimicrobial peptide transport system permease subunit